MSARPSLAVIIVAAGSGTRLGLGSPKAFVPVAGASILHHALRSVFAMREPAQVVIVAPQARLDEARQLAAEVAGSPDDVIVVAGGDTRQQSVAAGISVLAPEIDTVLVHDAARAFTPAELFDRVATEVRRTGGGVVPGLVPTDTIKELDGTTAVGTLDRSRLTAVQTPQGFPRQALQRSYQQATQEFTDDAALFAAAGHQVTVIEGDRRADKITTSWDLRRAELEHTAPTPSAMRTGIGVDVHAFDAEAPLWLGGLLWPGETGLSGHSDGDALSHAICDALLSAAGLGDIGGTFGTSDERYRGAHGDVFIAETVRLVTQAGFTIGNVAVQLLALRPRLAARRDEMQTHLGRLVGAPVSISATTTDGLGFVGRGDGVTAIATALLQTTVPPHGRP